MTTETESLGDESVGCRASVALVGLLLAVLLGAPVVAASLVSPWLGVALCVGSLVAWVWLGPRPMPGFVPGLVCPWGIAAIIGVLAWCVARGVRPPTS